MIAGRAIFVIEVRPFYLKGTKDWLSLYPLMEKKIAFNYRPSTSVRRGRLSGLSSTTVSSGIDLYTNLIMMPQAVRSQFDSELAQIRSKYLQVDGTGSCTVH